jgi:molybdopterin synthase catalytic subunit
VRTCITREPIDAAALLAAVAAPGHGAGLIFVGTVRDSNEGRAVEGIHYEAYEAMAEDVLRQIVTEAAARAGTHAIAAVHRVGELGLGEASVAIAVGSAHRAEAFEAVRYIIEEIKTRLPVWKQERYAGGDAQWVAGTVPPTAGGHA